MHDPDTTLVAVASPPGRGGVGCVRLSGAEAERIARALFRAGRSGDAERGGAPRFGRFLARDRRPIDHGYLVLFEPGASFTGEPVAELWAHGSPAVLAELVEAAVVEGAVPAGPGEFTYRALRHGRLDLARAEAIRDLVASRTLYQARLAFAQAEGALSRRVAPLRDGLADLIARGEAAVEFADEAETHLPAGGLSPGIEEARRACEAVLAGFRAGRVVREGATLAITGAPNVGKSSLFNRLLERERAIVAAQPGTTRDTVAETLDLGGIPVRLVDTAGIREEGDELESEGMRRAREARETADLVLWVLDASRPLDASERQELERPADGRPTVLAMNKSDLPGAATAPLPRPGALRVSALTGEGLPVLRRELRARLAVEGSLEDPVISDARHALALERAGGALDAASRAAASGLPDELVLEDLREAMHHVGEITGELGTDDLYERIFATFCIGK